MMIFILFYSQWRILLLFLFVCKAKVFFSLCYMCTKGKEVQHWISGIKDLFNEADSINGNTKFVDDKLLKYLFHDVLKYYIKNGNVLNLELAISNVLSKIQKTILIPIKPYNNNKKIQPQEINFHLLQFYTCSDDLFKYLTTYDKSGTKYSRWIDTVNEWRKLQPNSCNQITVVLTPHIGKLDAEKIGLHIKQLENDFHCRLILCIFQRKTPTVFGIYDCNGLDYNDNNIYCMMKSNLPNRDFLNHKFLSGITDQHNKMSLNGIGYFLNQWILFHHQTSNTDNNEIFRHSSCYFFTVWSAIAIVFSIIYHKEKISRYCALLKQAKNGTEASDCKDNIICFLAFEIQRLIISKIITDARECHQFEVNKKEMQLLKRNSQKVIKGARTKQTARKSTPGNGPRKETAIKSYRKQWFMRKRKCSIFKIKKQNQIKLK